jgi:inosine-uridine nucleoside N-ribohydrolase
LAISTPERFDLQGIVATHFAGNAGPDSTEQSYQLLMQLLRSAGKADQYATRRGGHPMQYPGVPTPSEGADLIIERAKAASEDDPLWIVVLGAATNTAGAILKAPEILPRIRVVFHARCSRLWPERTAQFNVIGDIIAAQTLLSSGVPLVWFDTGTKLTIPYTETERRLAPLCDMGRFLHDYRDTRPHFADPTKGFFDLGDIAWLTDPTLCAAETVPAPHLERHLAFNHERSRGQMLRVTDIDVPRTWALFFQHLQKAHSTGVIA